MVERLRVWWLRRPAGSRAPQCGWCWRRVRGRVHDGGYGPQHRRCELDVLPRLKAGDSNSYTPTRGGAQC